MAKKKTKANRRILKAKIEFLSLCPKGANQIQTVYKADGEEDSNIALSMLVKEGMTEQGELLAVVYAPDMQDSQGDTASEEVIKDFAYGFGAGGKGIDIRHNEKVLPMADAFVAESFIIQKDDPRFIDTKDYEGNSVDVTGGWGVVLKIENEGLRKQYRDGDWGGISMGGMMLAKEDNSELSTVMKMIGKLIENITGTSKIKKSEKPMEPKEKLELITEVTKAVIESLGEAKKEADKKLVEAKKAEDDKKTKLGMGYIEPVLKANPSDVEVEQHAKSVRIFELSKAVDSSDLDSINKFTVLKKQIIEGREVDIQKENGKAPYNAFHTNQTSSVRAAKADGDNAWGDLLLAQMKKEEEDEARARVA